MPMKTATVWTTAPDATDAAETLATKLLEALGAAPSFVVLHGTEGYDPGAISRVMARHFPSACLYGSSSFAGVMSGDGLHSEDDRALAAFGLVDPTGAFGCGTAPLADGARLASRRAAERALSRAGRPGEQPALVLLTAAPGAEEDVLEGIADVFGHEVPVCGGSSAHGLVGGRSWQLAGEEASTDGVAIAVLFPSADVAFGFHSGYEPTAHHGRVTRADGRVLLEIDGRPAAAVYDEWLDHALADVLVAGGPIFGRTALHPLATVAGTIGEHPYFCLAHPESIASGGGLGLFARIAEGTEVHLVESTPDALVRRAARVATAALETHGMAVGEVSGAIVIFCAGSMVPVRPRMAEVTSALGEALGGAPFLGTFTYGEQGSFPSGEHRHGNLMISVVAFGGRGPS